MDFFYLAHISRSCHPIIQDKKEACKRSKTQKRTQSKTRHAERRRTRKKSAFSFSFGTIITLSLMAFLGPSFAFSFCFLSLILCLWCRGMHVKKRREDKRWEQEIARNFRGSICGCGSPAVMQMQILVSSLFLCDSLPPSPPLSLAMRLVAYDVVFSLNFGCTEKRTMEGRKGFSMKRSVRKGVGQPTHSHMHKAKQNKQTKKKHKAPYCTVHMIF